jgi:5'-3' exonuclease
MGWRFFSQIFTPTRVVKYKDMSGMTIAIDAMTELYRAALGAKSVSTLTDANGNPTLHISVVLSIIIELQKQGVRQIWVFDHNQDPDSDFHNPMKNAELAKRKRRKEMAIDQIKSLSDVKDTAPMFSDDESDSTTHATSAKTLNKGDKGDSDDDGDGIQEVYLSSSLPTSSLPTSSLPTSLPSSSLPSSSSSQDIVLTPEEEAKYEKMSSRQKSSFMLMKNTQAQQAREFHATKKSRIMSLEKQTFSVSKDMIHDAKYILNCFGIQYVETPSGFEGEAIASYLASTGKANAVFSGDTDPMAYGAPVLFRRNAKDKQIYEYTQKDLLRQIADANEEIEKPTMAHLLKCAMIMGTDANIPKTPGIGPKTVLKKLHEIVLTSEQKAGMSEFTKKPDPSKIVICNQDKEAFGDDDRRAELVDWLVDQKSFSRSRIETQFGKIGEAPTTSLSSTSSKRSKNSSTLSTLSSSPKADPVDNTPRAPRRFTCKTIKSLIKPPAAARR